MPRQRLGQVSRELSWLGVGQALTVVASLAGVRLLTGVVRPDEYGRLSLLMTVSTLALLLVLGPALNGGARFFAPAVEARRLRSFLAALRRLLAYSMAAAAVLYAIVAVGLSLLGRGVWIVPVGLAFAFSLASACGETLNGVQNAARQRAVVAFHVAGITALRFVCGAAAAAWIAPTAAMVLWGYVVATLLGLISQLWFFRRRVRILGADSEPSDAAQERSYARQMLAFSWPFATWGIFQWLQQSSDRWSLQRFSGAGAVGVYAVVFQLGYTPLMLLSGLVNQMVSPILYSRAGDGTDPARMRAARQLNNRIAGAIAAVTVPAALVAWSVHHLVFRILVAPQYRDASYLFPWIVVAGGLFACGQTASLSLSIGLSTHRLIAPKIGGAIVGMTLNALGAYWYGMNGVVAALVTSSAIYAVWVIILVALEDRASRGALRDPAEDAGQLITSPAEAAIR